jgi:hypothetical protein
MKLNLFVITLCLLLPLYCHAIDKRIFGNYTHEYYTIDRLNFGYGTSLYKGILAETTSLNLTRIAKDSWNDFHDNYSVASLVPSLLGYFITTTYSDSTSETLKNLILAIPIMANSTVYYPLLKNNSPTISSLNVAPFIKNDTDLFMFRSAAWGQLTPGVGLRIYYGNSISESGAVIGIERSLQSDFKGKKNTKDLYYIRVGLNMNYHSLK